MLHFHVKLLCSKDKQEGFDVHWSAHHVQLPSRTYDLQDRVAAETFVLRRSRASPHQTEQDLEAHFSQIHLAYQWPGAITLPQLW